MCVLERDAIRGQRFDGAGMRREDDRLRDLVQRMGDSGERLRTDVCLAVEGQEEVAARLDTGARECRERS